jgi:hypothetical protein
MLFAEFAIFGPGFLWDLRGCDRMVVGFTTIYAINAYHH